MKRLLAAALAAGACTGGPVRPARLDAGNEACGWCRMVVSDPRFAAQLVAPSEEPVFFDDIGCMASYLKGRPLPLGAVAFVADHRAKEWVAAAGAVYTKVPLLATPMGSHLIAHASAASRAADPDANAGAPVSSADVFGPGGVPGDGR